MINKTNERKLFIGLPKCGSTSIQVIKVATKDEFERLVLYEAIMFIY